MNDPTGSEDKDAQALAAVESFDRPFEGEVAYDRLLGLARGKDGAVVAILRTKPDENGQTRLVARSREEIEAERRHDDNAERSPGFYDIEMKRAGRSSNEIVAFHVNNENILRRADGLIKDAQALNTPLPSVDDAIAKFGDPGFRAFAADSDFVSPTMFNNEPRYGALIGIARNEDGEPAALIESAPDANGKTTIFAMTEQELLQQIDHDKTAMTAPVFSDPGTARQMKESGVNRMDVDGRIVDLHVNNKQVLTGALESMHGALAAGGYMPTVPEAVAAYRDRQAASAPAPQTRIALAVPGAQP